MTTRPPLRTLALTGALTGSMVLASLVGAGASSHREAPLITEDPVADTTDVYAFVPAANPDNVALIANWIPLEEPASGPNFHKFGDDVLYSISVDNDGDAVEDVTFEFRFRSRVVNGDLPLYNAAPIVFNPSTGQYDGWNVPQTMTVTMVRGDERTVLGSNLRTPPVNVGPRSTPNYDELVAAAIHELDGGVTVFAGQRDETFPVDLGSVFDLLGLRPYNGFHEVGDLEAADGIDTTNGYNVHSIVIEVPKTLLVADDDVIGVWSDTYRRKNRIFAGEDGARLKHSGPWVQVSRLGNPLVNEVVIPLKDKDRFNASDPADDAQFASYVSNTILDDVVAALYGPKLSAALGDDFCFPDPAGQRDDLVAVFLTGIPGLNQPANVVPSEQLRLNTAIAPSAEESTLGVLGGDLAGYPNGRRPGDDVVDIALQAIGGAAGDCAGQVPATILMDGVGVNDAPGEPDLLDVFPYLPAPHSGYDSNSDS